MSKKPLMHSSKGKLILDLKWFNVRITLSKDKIFWILITISLSSSSEAFAQRFRNAAEFKTDSAQDKFVDENLLSFPSNEIVFYQSTKIPSQEGTKEDSYRMLDFLKIPNDADASVKVRNGYFLSETDPQGSVNIPTDPGVFTAL